MSQISDEAEVSTSASVGTGSKVWAMAQIREGARIGAECVIGRGAYVGAGVRLGDRVKVQNLAQVYEPAEIGDGVFLGPAVVLTNDQYPRAITPDGQIATVADWQPVGVVVRTGASVGARAVCVAPVEVGAWAMVAAGAVVVHDVPAFALVAGNPARQIGWVGRAGRRLVETVDGRFTCPATGTGYIERDGVLSEETYE